MSEVDAIQRSEAIDGGHQRFRIIISGFIARKFSRKTSLEEGLYAAPLRGDVNRQTPEGSRKLESVLCCRRYKIPSEYTQPCRKGSRRLKIYLRVVDESVGTHRESIGDIINIRIG